MYMLVNAGFRNLYNIYKNNQNFLKECDAKLINAIIKRQKIIQ